MGIPSFRKLEKDLEVNKTTLHNWKKNRPKLYEFIIDSYRNKEILQKHLDFMIEQRRYIEDQIKTTKQVI